MIPTVKEKTVKIVRRMYEIPLTDRHRDKEGQKVAVDGLESIDRTRLPGKLKALCYRHGLSHRNL